MLSDRAVRPGSMSSHVRRAAAWPRRVVIVESPSIASTLVSPLTRDPDVGLELVRSSDAVSALIELGDSSAHAVVIPTDVVGMSVVDFTGIVRALTDAVVLVALASDREREIAVDALGAGARGIVTLPLEPVRLADELRSIWTMRSLTAIASSGSCTRAG